MDPTRPTGIDHSHVIQNQISTINIGGVDADVAANNGQDYTITINSTTVTYTVNIAAPQSDNEVVDILNGLRTQIINANLQVDPVVVGGNSLRITSRNRLPFNLSSTSPGINALTFACSKSNTISNKFSYNLWRSYCSWACSRYSIWIYYFNSE